MLKIDTAFKVELVEADAWIYVNITRIFMKLFKIVLIFLFTSSFLSAFSFNNWHSGMTLDQAIEVNTLEQVHVEGEGHVCNNTCRHIFVTQEILGATAKVTLRFTLNSKVLYSVEVLWGTGVAKEDMQKFTDELIAYLDRQYGDINVNMRPNYNDHSPFKQKKWEPEPNTQIVARRGVSSLTLILTDKELESNHDFEMSQYLKEKNK